jgi:Fungal Zn(2)-Cys(6) binuclear cluster domain
MKNVSDGPCQPAAKRRRRNALRACDHCKAKKIKCDGVQPCSRCSTHSLTCTYETTYSRGLAPPPISAAPVASAAPARQDSLNSAVGNVTRDVSRSVSFTREGQAIGDVSRNASQTPEENREEGFLGASSNITYSHVARLHLGSKSRSPSSTSQEFQPGIRYKQQLPNPDVGPKTEKEVFGWPSQPPTTQKRRTSKQISLYFGEPPFPSLNLARYTLPSVERGLEMISWYFDNASPTYRFLHRPSVEKMGRGLCSSGSWLGRDAVNAEMEEGEDCVVLMVWALGCQYPMSQSGKPFTNEESEWLRQKG